MPFKDTEESSFSIGFGTGITNLGELREAENSLMPKRKEGVFGNGGLIYAPRKQKIPDDDGYITTDSGIRINHKNIYKHFAALEQEEQTAQRQNITFLKKKGCISES